MYRYILCACITMLAQIASSLAQTPSYQFSAFTGSGSQGGAGGEEFIEQSLYTRTSFPTMPAGRVKAIYFRVSTIYTINPNAGTKCAFQQFSAKIGYITDSAYKLTGTDTFRTGLTTVYGPDTFSIPCNAAGGTWIRIPVKKGNFWYSPEQKFAVEISAGPSSINWHGSPNLANSTQPTGYRRTLYVLDRSLKSSSAISAGMDLGIDLGTPDDVEGFSNISSFGLFPNPATDGRFNVSFEATRSAKEAVVVINDATGRQIYERRIANPGNRFFEELKLGQIAKGVYFLRLIVDGESLNRRLVLQ